MTICLAWNIYSFPYPHPKCQEGQTFFLTESSHTAGQVTEGAREGGRGSTDSGSGVMTLGRATQECRELRSGPGGRFTRATAFLWGTLPLRDHPPQPHPGHLTHHWQLSVYATGSPTDPEAAQNQGPYLFISVSLVHGAWEELRVRTWNPILRGPWWLKNCSVPCLALLQRRVSRHDPEKSSVRRGLQKGGSSPDVGTTWLCHKLRDRC